MSEKTSGWPASTTSEESGWADYYSATASRPPTACLMAALAYVKPKTPVLDLGCGAGRDTRYLLEQGFAVTAVDANPAAQHRLAQLPHQERLKFVCSPYDEFAFTPSSYSLVNAQYALPFNPPESFDHMFASMIASLKPGGVFAGQLFGDHDAWNAPKSGMTFHTGDQARALFGGLDLKLFDEVDHDGNLADGRPKHWHYFDIVVVKTETTSL